jgi:hypothetical protein
METTTSSCWSNCRTPCEPMNPEAPVTSTVVSDGALPTLRFPLVLTDVTTATSHHLVPTSSGRFEWTIYANPELTQRVTADTSRSCVKDAC